MATTAKTKTEEVKETKEVKDDKAYWEERIPFTIPFDRNDNSDVLIIVNGYRYQIQRGEEVMLPRNAIEVWKQSQAQDLATWRAAQAAERDYENEVKSRGL